MPVFLSELNAWVFAAIAGFFCLGGLFYGVSQVEHGDTLGGAYHSGLEEGVLDPQLDDRAPSMMVASAHADEAAATQDAPQSPDQEKAIPSEKPASPEQPIAEQVVKQPEKHVTVAPWGYKGDNGPQHWADLKRSYSVCRSGKSQSPINISSALAAKEQKSLRFRYKKSGFKLANTGRVLSGTFKTKQWIEFDGRRYDLTKVDFHVRSEHAMNGLLYDMEAQLFHEDAKGHTIVVAVLVEEGTKNMALAKHWRGLPETGKSKKPIAMNPDQILPGHREFYQYSGSLTSPPCTEGVTWLVMRDPIQFSPKQIEDAVYAMGGTNNRPLQAMFARESLFYQATN